jgi:regulator of replication initiation timing
MKFKRTLLATSLLFAGVAQAAAPSNEEIWQMLQDMKAQMSEIQQQNQQLKSENEALKNQVAVTEQVANEAAQAAEAVAVVAEEAVKSSSNSFLNKTSIGGYGELHYNNLDDQHGDNDLDRLDFHRFVLFFGHEFTDSLRFFSELELEHSLSSEDGPGEVELEQAYIEYDINEQHRVKGGVFLLPVGILNETHEPNTFYGTERNSVEARIIPSTWWEGGVMFSGEIAEGFSYDLAIHSGLATTDGSSNFAVRSGRQKVAEALANDLAYTGRIKWTGLPGIELSASAQYQEDITQGQVANAGSATLFETHAVIERGQFGLRALYATWDLDGSAPAAVGADEQTGWYIEPSFRINQHFGLFTRYSEWDNRAGDSVDTEIEQWDIGVNWWPHRNVVVKADYQDQDAPAGSTERDGLNIGIGYEF